MSTIEPTTMGKTMTFLLPKRTRVVWQAIIINILIFLLILMSPYLIALTFVGGLLIILYLTIKAIYAPVETFFLIFGIKLTFDAFWVVKLYLPGIEKFGLLELFFIPLLLVILWGPKLRRYGSLWPLWCALIYILWIIIARILNGYDFNIELFVRQSGILVGLLAGLRYIRDKEDFDSLMYLLFISTIIPVLASLFQILASQVQLDLTFLHFKLDSTRGIRAAGLYYDSGTAGMVNIISLLSNGYILISGTIKGKIRNHHIMFIFLSILSILAGGTLSMIATASLVSIGLLMIRLKEKIVIILPLGLLLILISQYCLQDMYRIPYMNKVALKITEESERLSKISSIQDILQETEYRAMFTGRVGLWQDIWQRFNSGTPTQKMFGTGLASMGAHSSYFLLLLEIGWLGILFYLIFHVGLILKLWRMRIPGVEKTIAITYLLSVLLIGFSLTTVLYTSFQWIAYLLVGAALNIGYSATFGRQSYAALGDVRHNLAAVP